MDMKKLKRILAIALLVTVGAYSVWNYFNGDVDSGSENQTNVDVSDNQDDLLLVEEDSLDISEVESGEALNIEADSEEVEEVLNDETSTHQGDYELPYELIIEYADIVDVVYLDSLPTNVIDSYEQYADDGWDGLVAGQSEGTKAGGRWGNYDDQLPIYSSDGDTISYKEFDVNDKIAGQSRDAERFVVGDDGSVYYTYDHYDSFVLVIE